MKVRQSASLVAGVCTLCVAASTSVTPVAAAAATPSPVQRPVELTAASDVFIDGINVAGLPLQNFVTVLNALAGVAGGSNGTGAGGAASLQALPNLLYSQLVAGTLTEASATAAINAALATQQTALANLSATPGKLIATDLAAINKLLADLGIGSLGTATTFKAADVGTGSALSAPDASGVDIANAVSLPLQNFVTILNAIAGAVGGGDGTGSSDSAKTSFQALPNLLYSQLVAGTLTQASFEKAFSAAVATEQKALSNLGFGSLGAATTFKAAAVGPTVMAAVQQPALGSGIDLANVVRLPLQNGITAINALAGAAGGGDGTGSSDSAKLSFQALPNNLYSQLVAGKLTDESATKAFNDAVKTEQTALNNLAATPGKIIATDVAAIQKLGLTNATATSFTNDTVAKPKAATIETNAVAVQKDTKDVAAGSTTQPRHAAKSNDNNPVSSAIKAIKEASKGSYVGKHRAGDGGEKTSGAENASKGSDEK